MVDLTKIDTENLVIGSLPRSGSTFLYNILLSKYNGNGVGEWFVPENFYSYKPNELEVKIKTYTENSLLKIHGNQLYSIKSIDSNFFNNLCKKRWIVNYRKDWFYSVVSFIHAFYNKNFQADDKNRIKIVADISLVDKILNQYTSWNELVGYIDDISFLAYEEWCQNQKNHYDIYKEDILNYSEVYDYCLKKYENIGKFYDRIQNSRPV